MVIDLDKALEEYIKQQPEPEKKDKPVAVVVPLERIKGDPVTVFDRFAYNQLSDVVVDCQQYDAINVLVLPSGTSPSATVSVEGAASGLYVPLNTPGAVQPNVTTNTSFDVSVSTPLVKIRLSNVSGTFGRDQGFTVIVTPYRRGPLGVIDRANYGTITAAEGTVTLDVKGCGSAAVQITGTWSATASFEGTLDDSAWVAVYGVVPGTGASVTSSTANGLWIVPCAGLSQIRVRASAFASGTIVVNLRASVGSDVFLITGSLPAGTSNIGDVDVLSIATGANVIGKVGIDQTTPGTTNAVQPKAADGSALFAVPPQLDTTDRMAVSLYCKATAAGDASLLSIATSGAGLGVLQTGTLGESFELLASAARTTSANGSTVSGLDWRRKYNFLLTLAAPGGIAGDLLDVYIDALSDGTGAAAWVNVVHFTQRAGNSGAITELAVLDPTNPGTSVFDVSADCASGVTRPSIVGTGFRARWAITDGGGAKSFTFGISAFAQ